MYGLMSESSRQDELLDIWLNNTPFKVVELADGRRYEKSRLYDEDGVRSNFLICAWEGDLSDGNIQPIGYTFYCEREDISVLMTRISVKDNKLRICGDRY